MATRVTFIMQLTTAPPDRTTAAPHTAGWSESWWQAANLASNDPKIDALATKRALLLPAQGSVIGYRVAKYTVSGNKISPIGSATGKLQKPGNPTRPTDLPQVGLEMSGTTAGGPNTSRFTCRGIPDIVMQFGEYQPDAGFQSVVTQFRNLLVSDSWCFLGRNLAAVSQNVLAIAGSLVTLTGSLGVVAGDSLRFNRVHDDAGNAIKGAYMIGSLGGPGQYNLLGFPGATLTIPNGTARRDLIDVFPFATVTPGRAIVKKVGRPFESYRGRQSKR